jgi:hypothetical protein
MHLKNKFRSLRSVKQVVSEGGKGNKSIGARGLKPYTTWNGLTFIVEWTDLL